MNTMPTNTTAAVAHAIGDQIGPAFLIDWTIAASCSAAGLASAKQKSTIGTRERFSKLMLPSLCEQPCLILAAGVTENLAPLGPVFCQRPHHLNCKYLIFH